MKPFAAKNINSGQQTLDFGTSAKANGPRLRDALAMLRRNLPSEFGGIKKATIVAALAALESNTFHKNGTIQQGYGFGLSVTELAAQAGLNRKSMYRVLSLLMAWEVVKVNTEKGRKIGRKPYRPARLLQWDLDKLWSESWCNWSDADVLRRFEEKLKSTSYRLELRSQAKADEEASPRRLRTVGASQPVVTAGIRDEQSGVTATPGDNVSTPSTPGDVIAPPSDNATPDDSSRTATADAARNDGPSTTDDSQETTSGADTVDDVLSHIIHSAERRRAQWRFLRETPYVLRDGTLYWLLESADNFAFADRNKAQLLQWCYMHIWRLGIRSEDFRIDLRLLEPTLERKEPVEAEVPNEPEVVKP